MITVHHLERSRSQATLWLLEELGCEYQIERYARDPKTQLAPPALQAVHPLGKSPVITDGDYTVAESGAIVEYLVGSYDRGRLCPPTGTPARRQYSYWLHYAEGSAMPPLVMSLVFRMMAEAPMPFFVRPLVRSILRPVSTTFLEPTLRRHFAFWESTLARQPWFAGDAFTAADIQMSTPVQMAAVRSDIPLGPAVRGFLERVRARPAFQRAARAGGERQAAG
ncbi:MAG: glutathione S-transferase [Proteobacteria bacterium]|nr:glutathione S-transferase [Pseudomonadota bacterium]